MSTATDSSTSSTRALQKDEQHEDNTGLPIIDSLADPFETPQGLYTANGPSAIHRHAATIRKLKEQEPRNTGTTKQNPSNA
jgi:hypothetical protein